ncbi:hypothetical protein [Spiroplasma taiwanense]|uniref:hypothetical protein n=1 Tax=Spiroplasma taiwanense TaxID=2145 RepID=UPI0005A25133|nr:hypothetical protein [Spiroplasma taiwanense]
MFAYFATITGMMEYSSVVVPWTTPPILGGLLATKDIWGGIVVDINMAILFGCYSPFVLLANKIEQKELLSKFTKTQNIEEKSINRSILN